MRVTIANHGQTSGHCGFHPLNIGRNRCRHYALAGLFRSTVSLNGRINGVFSATNQTPLPEPTDDLLAQAG